MSEVTVYGADWCHDTADTRRELDRLGVEYEYVDVDRNSDASEWVKAQNGGRERKPTVEVGDRILSVPGPQELEKALRAEGILG